MTKNELIAKVVPGTIAQWTVDSPQYKHSGKAPQLLNMYKSYNKAELEKKYNYLVERGFIS